MSTFDYTSRDYFSIKQDLLARAEQVLPEWTSRDSSDFGMLLVDLWAYMGDILHYYVDKAAQESFLTTATQRESILAIANLLDYVPTGRAPAHASISLVATNSAATDETPILIPKYTRFLAKPLLETADDVVFTSDKAIAFNSTGAAISGYEVYQKGTSVELNLTEGEMYQESFTSDGRISQQYMLSTTGIVNSSIEVYVAEGANGAEIPYTQVTRLIEATNSDLVFSVTLSADDTSTIVFGNSVHGKIPTTNAVVRIVYRRSRGAAGNVDINAIREFESLNNIYGPPYDGVSITPNTTKAIGGTDSESITSLKTNIPASFRSQDRAVSIQDYVDLTLRVPGIVKATAKVNANTPIQGLIISKKIQDNQVVLGTASAHGLSVSDIVGISGLGYPYDGSFELVTASASVLAYNLDITEPNSASVVVSSSTAQYRNDNVRIYALTDQSVYDGTLSVEPTTSPLALENSIRNSIYEYIQPRQMFGVNSVVMPSITLTSVYVSLTLNVMSTYSQDAVKTDVEDAIKDLFSFQNVTFDQIITLGTLYRTVLDIAGVDYITISTFNTSGTPNEISTVGISPSVKGITTTTGTLLLLEDLAVTASGGIAVA
jgi:uncharacterized phage protein gp47/JayE